ncbi:GntR family transcriptional regulator [Xanthomonas sp. GPE 39]|uniref:GntR family transcriptional regulator n=1 Tax=Xanthomonas sp. GPE 39 TaxID=1583099 RepID=UPI0005F2C164|nr:GntR family transcriptional regulator [Xanthomonas sp. GPE 39]
MTKSKPPADPRLRGLAVDSDAPTPLYLQLASKLVGAIKAGQWKPGEALPAERQLCEHLKISRVTLRQAVDALVEQGLVSRRQGAGTFVTSHIQHQLSGLASFTETVRMEGLEPGTRWLERRTRPAHGEEILRLGLSPDTAVTELTRLRSADGRVMAYEEAVLPQYVVPDPKAIVDSLYAYLDERGTPVVRALQHFRAINLPARLAGHLAMKEGEAILHVVRVGYARDGSAIELTDTYCHNDYYDFVAELRR